MIKHNFSRLTFSLLIPALLLGLGSTPVTAKSHAASSPDLRILASDSTGLTVELSVPSLSLTPSSSDQGACLSASVPQWGSSSSVGEPSLPVRGTLLGLPNGQPARVKVLAADFLSLGDGITLCPAATRRTVQSIYGGLTEGGESLLINPQAYLVDHDFPGQFAQISLPERLRGQWVTRLTLQPFQYNPVTRRLRAYSHLKVHITFASADSTSFQSSATRDTLFSGILLNEVQANTWRGVPLNGLQTNQPDFIPPTGPAVKIAVSKDGLVQVNYEKLLQAGAPVDSINPLTFHITSSSGKSDLTLDSDGDDVFEPGERILFYGLKTNTRYTDTNIYWITWGGENSSSIASVDAAPTTGTTPSSFTSVAHFEQDKLYQQNFPSGPDQDHWYWDFVYATPPPVTIPPSPPPSKNFEVFLSHVAETGGTAKIRGLLRGFSANPQHDTKIYLNDTLIHEYFWPAQSEMSFEENVSQSLLRESDGVTKNEIKVECPLTGGATLDIPMINWFEIEYAKTYTAEGPWTQFGIDTAGNWKPVVSGFLADDTQIWDITDPLHPLHLENPTVQMDGSTYTITLHQSTGGARRYLAGSPSQIAFADTLTLVTPVNLRDAANGADYLIITHPDFLSTIQPLADFHTAQGMRVKIINVQDIYDNFSGGVFNPMAIHDFIAYAYAYWQTPAPAYVLLVGDGNYDFKNILERNDLNYIPPFLSMADPWIGEVAADNRYVTVDGDDPLPDMALGRLPVRSPAEAAGVVNKILSYATDSYSGNWGRSFLLIADKNDPSVGNFPALSDQLATDWLTPRRLNIAKIYYTITHSTADDTRTAIVNSVNAGVGIVFYSGHSSPIQWSKGNILDDTSLSSLNNKSTLPILVSLTCYTGIYYFPNNAQTGFSSLDEQLIRAPEKGMVASFSPMGEGMTEGHDILARGLLDALFNHTSQIGLATSMAKVYLYGVSASNHELIDTFLLFGDPALTLPFDKKVFIPAVMR